MHDHQFARISIDPAAVQIAAELLMLTDSHPDATEFLAVALPRLAHVGHGTDVVVAAMSGGSYDVLGEAGGGARLPLALVSEALDREGATQQGDWTAAPLYPRSAEGMVLAIRGRSAAAQVDALAAALGVALVSVRHKQRDRRRIRRLETILEIAQQWNRTHEMEPLLIEMAEAATRLLQADRASIFLWDRDTKTLVGRPALGVEGGELRIAEDVGLVGQVVQSGVPQRANQNAQRDEIDRSVDQQLGFRTETLLCVPLNGKDGRRLGAFEVINRISGNFTDEDEAALVELAAHAALALENTQTFEELLTRHRQIVDQAADEIQLIGNSPAVLALRSTVQRVAATELAILILGENGTGKEVVSQSVHYLSRRRDRPFIAVNCAALSETLLESELFGHEKGAFTDAHESRQGKFELAAGGTLFLDEIGDLSLGGQAKLLRVLEEKIVVRVGGSTPIHTDARVLAATNQNLAEMVSTKTFREDLYYRLNVVSLELPPLRERGEDIVLLANHFLANFCRGTGRPAPKFSPEAEKRLLSHRWPGNVRELRNLMERLAYLLPSDRVEADDFAFILSPTRGPGDAIQDDLPLADATHRFQVGYIRTAIDRARGNMSDAAEQLGLHRSNLYRKMRQLDMPVRD